MYDYKLISLMNNIRRIGARFPRYPWEGFDSACVANARVNGRDRTGRSQLTSDFWPICVSRGPYQDLKMYERRLAAVEARLASRSRSRAERRCDREKRQCFRSFVAQLRGEPGAIPPEAGEEYRAWVRGLREGIWKDRIPTAEDTARTWRAVHRSAQAERNAFELR
jgi:hypothetical protein